MATKAARPGRRLMIFGLAIVLLYGLVALGGTWQPKLGLDLQGGTRITLEASTANGQAVTTEKLAEARGIIDQRVNGSGVTESEVGTQGNNQIVVEIPGKNRKDLVDTVSQTAQLRFRLVAAAAAGQPQPAPSSSPSAAPSGAASPSSEPSAASSARPSSSASPRGRALSGGLLAADKGSRPAAKPSKAATPSATPLAAPSAVPTAPTTAAPTTTPRGAPVNQPLRWQANPGNAWLRKFAAFTCPKHHAVAPVNDVPDKPLITCDAHGNKYLLSVAAIEGTQLSSASAGAPDQQNVQWSVNLGFNGSGRKTFADLSKALVGTQKQFAIVLDGKVLSAPVFNSEILNGQAQITGNFTQAEALSLANSLKYGSLPLKFTVPVVTEEGPTLAADQLTAGLWAGMIGLLLVMIYCLLYYRGLGIVVIASLVVAAVITYAMVLILSEAVSFALTLPGIAGLIVAIGITADSFIVYFERIRDEMREGRSMRVAVESGWKRARATCLAADSVSLLAAVVLYVFAIGVVRGFAFALGLSTVIDLVVFFLFTKPMVSWLATKPFFYTGNKWSGLSPDHIGIERIGVAATTSPAGGRA